MRRRATSLPLASRTRIVAPEHGAVVAGGIVDRDDRAGRAGEHVALDPGSTRQDPAGAAATGPGTPDGIGGPVCGHEGDAAVARDRVRPAVAIDTAGLAVAPADLEDDLEAVVGLDVASQKQQPPIRSGSLGPMPARPGTTSATRAAAASGVLTGTGRALGLGLWSVEVDAAPPAQPPTMMARVASGE